MTIPDNEEPASLQACAAMMASIPPGEFDAAWPRLAVHLHEALLAGGWRYLAMLTRASLVEGGHWQARSPEYIDSLIDNYRINEALYLSLSRAGAAQLRPFRLPARRWNLVGTDRWVSAEDWKDVFAEIARHASSSPVEELVNTMKRRFSALNDRLKDGAVIYMMRHAGALNGMQWRRLTKATRHEVVHVRLHAATGFLTTSVRVGGVTQRVTHVLPLEMLALATDDERGQGLDSHFGMRKLSRLVFELLRDVRNKTEPASTVFPKLRFFYDLLLAPIFAKPGVAEGIAALGEHPTLVIATHGSMAQLPFAALHDGQSYLADRFNIVQAPPLFPAEDFGTGDIDWDAMMGGDPIQPSARARGLFARGEFGLSHAPTDANNLIEHFGVRGSETVSEDWSSETLRELSRQPGIGFLSAHVEPSPLGGASTAVRTPKGDLVAFSDIADRPMSADLMVLAGCLSLGQSDWLSDGENSVVSLYRRAGVQAVISTLWPVDDGATSIYLDALMNGLAQGASRAKAHGNAVRQTMRTQLTIEEAFAEPKDRLFKQRSGHEAAPAIPMLSYDHPRFWGGFILSGAWR